MVHFFHFVKTQQQSLLNITMQDSIEYPSEEEVYRKLCFDLERYGWSILSTYYKGELFTHTVGLSWQYEHPEIEILGLNEEVAALMLNELAGRIKCGENFENKSIIDDLVDEVELMLVHNPLDPNGPAITSGRLRLIWPDEDHRYPWEKGCDSECTIQLWFPDSTMPNREAYEAYAVLERAANF